jgi:subtilisin family serine protease
MQLQSVFLLPAFLVLTGLSVCSEASSAPLRANSNRCIVKVNHTAAANNKSKPFNFRSVDPSRRAPVELGVMEFTSAASIGDEQVSVSAQTMTSVCNQLKDYFPGVVLAASPDFEVSISTIPNDAGYSSLYGMTKIKAPEAWDVSHEADDVVVGIIDTGIDYNHPDLSGNIWTNQGEIPGNGIDDDSNGFIDDVHGYDFHGNDGDPLDDNGHGTHCAGTIGGRGNNGIGVAGVTWSVKMAGLKFLGANGSGYLSNAIRAINYASMMGFKITNNSWGGGGFSQVMSDAIKSAGDAGMLFVAAAGNSGVNADVIPMYPAAYNLPNIVSVAATDSSDLLAYFSNYGVTNVDLAAPGVGIYSTYKNGQYATLSGTSMATPHVTGMSALLKAVYPNYSFAQLKDALLNNTDYKNNLAGFVATSGRANLYKSVINGENGNEGDSSSFDINLFKQLNFASDPVSKVQPRDRLELRLTNETGSSVEAYFNAGGLSCNLGTYTNDKTWTFGVGDRILRYFVRFTFGVTDGIDTVKTTIQVESLSAHVKGVSADKEKAFERLCSRLGGSVN